jgi:hypothetical protein
MYNALGGLGGSGQIDSTVAANATVALLSASAVTALFIVGPIFKIIGPMWSLLIGGWTYALYSGSLLSYNRRFLPLEETWASDDHYTDNCTDTKNAGFVIGSGAILGVGASFLWISQGRVQCNALSHAES